MLYRLRTRLNKALFDINVRAIKRTPPIVAQGDDLLFVSQLRSSDVLMYLLAIKSIHRRIGRGGVLVVDDGLSERDRALLAAHVSGIRFRNIGEVDTGRCPRGNTWERLTTILDESRERYVIQVDADLLALGPIDHVAECVDANRAFVLTTPATPTFVTCAEIARMQQPYLRRPDAHPQPFAEAHLDRLPDADNRWYIRGCSGFSGLARGGADRRLIEEFSTMMEELVGPRWREWGSEQIASNFAVSNSPDPVALPVEGYRNFWPDESLDGSRLIHFWGTHRFRNGVYSKLAMQQIVALAGQ